MSYNRRPLKKSCNSVKEARKQVKGFININLFQLHVLKEKKKAGFKIAKSS